MSYLLTVVPPQPNSPPNNVFCLDRPVKRVLGPKILRVHTSFEVDVRLPGKAPKGTVPSLSPILYAPNRSHYKSNSSSLPTTNNFRTGTPCPALRANRLPKVKYQFCQLPMPTLFHRPKLIHISRGPKHERCKQATPNIG
ncbi:hypothetical protein H5410_031065 [Solanum commersonii]|uniref:Uncharacterized protein n=1 Tax=Solanum commersonii TaxID=4109 RepID=A0A9J5YIS7_SOLCO|nr:hypothetical protein H5410_031065 [Solanum commersonii]